MGGRSTHTSPKTLFDLIQSGMKNGPDDQRNNEQEERAAWDEEKTRLQETHRKRVIFNVSSEDTEYLIGNNSPCREGDRRSMLKPPTTRSSFFRCTDQRAREEPIISAIP